MSLDDSLVAGALSLAKAWVEGDEAAIAAEDTTVWSSKQWEVMAWCGT